jgi:hypothetical protein
VAEKLTRDHRHHAEAFALTASFRMPLKHEIKPQAYAKLGEEGGYLSHRAEALQAEGLVSYRSARTHVAGGPDEKPGYSWSTLTTAVIEGLNVMEVVTADRVVAQINVAHPAEGYVPSVSFLGTRFENLCIAGHQLQVDLDLQLFGAKPKRDAAYSNDAGCAKRLKTHYARIQNLRGLPPEVAARYKKLPAISKSQRSHECSLVTRVRGKFPGRSFGHVLDVPNFGKIHLATVGLEESDFVPHKRSVKNTVITLTMLDIEMGCIAAGSMQLASGKTNGRTVP